jgi:hypothetical protein
MPPRRPKDKGTDAERAVVRFLQARGFPQAERRASNGNADRGDITGCPGICWEVKYRDMMPGDGRINMWLVETDRERDNAGADIGILVVRRPHAGVASWWAIARLGDLMALRDPSTPREMRTSWPVRMLLSDAVITLRAAGYGTPLPEVSDGD